jgi:hypothetical protein
MASLNVYKFVLIMGVLLGFVLIPALIQAEPEIITMVKEDLDDLEMELNGSYGKPGVIPYYPYSGPIDINILKSADDFKDKFKSRQYYVPDPDALKWKIMNYRYHFGTIAVFVFFAVILGVLSVMPAGGKSQTNKFIKVLLFIIVGIWIWQVFIWPYSEYNFSNEREPSAWDFYNEVVPQDPYYSYVTDGGDNWLISSSGPDLDSDLLIIVGPNIGAFMRQDRPWRKLEYNSDLYYDPTNGLISGGDIISGSYDYNF